MREQLLLNRLDDIGKNLAQTDGALLLLALGSVGIELERLDAYSDLDFFVIVKPGFKPRFIDQLDWLESVHPLGYSFQNTKDGHKILFEDGIYGEFAIFEEQEMTSIAYSAGRIVWQDALFTNPNLGTPRQKTDVARPETMDYALNEALTNLYVGLCRYARGEKLSGVKFVETSAVDNIISILHLVEQENDYFPDVFGNERRVEKRFPEFTKRMCNMMQGYENVPSSAIEILAYIEKIYPVNQKMSNEIKRLSAMCLQEKSD
ncbi:hypothetical protein [Paenisporosarcina quisquiliarum]|uniref:hypothetical protein n=1 Tax=Paenisporosarcina quisquiliarum TaxID=365346 RepID=UPI0037354BC0